MLSNIELAITELRVLRACFSLGEQGDWCPDAIKRQLVAEGNTQEWAEEALALCVANGSVVVSQPDEADILQFPVRAKA